MRATAPKRLQSRARRTLRARKNIKGRIDNGRVRLSVFRSSKHIYAQIIDDRVGQTLAAANSKAIETSGSKIDQAKEVGRLLAERALAKNVKHIVFDRGAYKYHGRVAALAEAAREGGLEF